jgi:hypothetical protein
VKVTQIVIDYQVTRSREFQSVRLGGSVTVEVSEGDDKMQTMKKTTRWLADYLNLQAGEALDAAIEERRMVEGIRI